METGSGINMKLRVGLLVFTILPLCTFAAAQDLTLQPWNPTGIYGIGQRVGWTIIAESGKTPAGKYTYEIRENNFDVIKSGQLDLSSGTTTVEARLNEPGMLYLEITPPSGEKPIAAGAAVAPTQIQPVIPPPAD